LRTFKHDKLTVLHSNQMIPSITVVPPVNPFYNPISSSSRSTRQNTLWVDSFTAPAYQSAGDTSKIRGNAPNCIKQLTLNTFGADTVQPEGSFAHSVANNIRFDEMDIMEQDGIGRQVRTVAEIIVSKGGALYSLPMRIEALEI
jgi:hypothetical protein